MTEKRIKEIYNQENIIIDSLRTQLKTAECKECVNSSIKYHIELLDIITFIIEQRLWGVIK